MKDILKAVSYCENIAKDDSHGYSQLHRNGDPDFDCSSLIGTALNYAGFDVKKTSTTRSLRTQLTRNGFVECGPPFRRGDIHLKEGVHVCMSTDENHIVHARYDENGGIAGNKPGDQKGDEIAITKYYVPAGGWDYHYRYPTKHVDNKKSPSIDEAFITEVIKGKYGNGESRAETLRKMGYNYHKVMLAVNKRLGVSGLREIAQAVIDGKFGSGKTRQKALTEAGWDYEKVQKFVNQIYKDREDF